MSHRVTGRPLSFAAAARELSAPGLGGVVLFAGRVRAERVGGSRVTALEYEAHVPPALRVFEELDKEARRKFGVERTVLWHRIGRVRAGEISVIVGAAAAHRAPAFAAARFLIDRLKTTVPIWKTEFGRSARPGRNRPAPPRSSGTP